MQTHTDKKPCEFPNGRTRMINPLAITNFVLINSSFKLVQQWQRQCQRRQRQLRRVRDPRVSSRRPNHNARCQPPLHTHRLFVLFLGGFFGQIRFASSARRPTSAMAGFGRFNNKFANFGKNARLSNPRETCRRLAQRNQSTSTRAPQCKRYDSPVGTTRAQSSYITQVRGIR